MGQTGHKRVKLRTKRLPTPLIVCKPYIPGSACDIPLLQTPQALELIASYHGMIGTQPTTCTEARIRN
eukprot:5249888-Amphidinium_carterae.1